MEIKKIELFGYKRLSAHTIQTVLKKSRNLGLNLSTKMHVRFLHILAAPFHVKQFETFETNYC